MTNNNQVSIFNRGLSPVWQGIISAGIILTFHLFVLIGKSIGSNVLTDRTYWVNAIAVLLFFSLFNSVFSIASKDMNQYWFRSIITFVALCIFGGITAWLFSGMSIDEAGSFRWLYLVFTIGYLIFLTLIRAMKKIVRLAQKQDKRLRGEE